MSAPVARAKRARKYNPAKRQDFLIKKAWAIAGISLMATSTLAPAAQAYSVSGHEVGDPVAAADAAQQSQNIPVDTHALDEAVQKAQQAGLKVEVEDTAVTKVSNAEVPQALADATQQVSADTTRVNDAVQKYQKDVAERQKTIEDNQKVHDEAVAARDARIKELQDAHDKAVAARDAQIAQNKKVHDEAVAAREAKIAEGEKSLAEKNAQLDALLKKAGGLNVQVSQEDQQVKSSYEEALSDLDSQIQAVQEIISAREAEEARLQADRIVQPKVQLKCEPYNIATLNDISNSVTATGADSELEKLKAANRSIIEAWSKVPGTTFTPFTMGAVSPVNFQKAVSYTTGTGEVITLKYNQPKTFHISDPQGKAEALEWVNGMTIGADENGKPATNVPYGAFPVDDGEVHNVQTLSTNHVAGLRAVEAYMKDTGVTFNTLLLASDGASTSGGDQVGQPGDFEQVGWYSKSSVAATHQQILHMEEEYPMRVIPVLVADKGPEPWNANPEVSERVFASVANSKNPVEGKTYVKNSDISTIAQDLIAAANLTCPKVPHHPVKVEIPEVPPMEEVPPVPPVEDVPPVPPVQDVPEVEVPSLKVRKPKLVTGTEVPVKVAHDEDKTVLAGQDTYQDISQSTGYRVPDSFVLGDIAYFGERDGQQVPLVSIDASKLKVTAADGSDVTGWFDVKVEEGTAPNGKKAFIVTATAKQDNLKDLGIAQTYTLHVTQTALADGVADDEVDFGFSIVNDKMVFTTDHVYHEDIPSPKKVVKNTRGVDVDGKVVLPGQELVYELHPQLALVKNSQGVLNQFDGDDDLDPKFVADESAGASKIMTASGVDVSDWFDITVSNTDHKARYVLHADKYELASKLGEDLVWSIPGRISPDAAPGDVKNSFVQVINGAKYNSNTVTNRIPKVEPHKYDVTSEGADRDGKQVQVGDKLVYPLVMDSSNLTDTAYEVQKFGIRDDYDQDKVKALASTVKVYQVPGDTDLSDKNRIKGIAEAGVDVTDRFEVTDDGDNVFVTMRHNADGSLVLPMGYKYIAILEAEVTADVDGEIVNTAYQIVNDRELVTETVRNPLKKRVVPPAPVVENPPADAGEPPVPSVGTPPAPVVGNPPADILVKSGLAHRDGDSVSPSGLGLLALGVGVSALGASAAYGVSRARKRREVKSSVQDVQ